MIRKAIIILAIVGISSVSLANNKPKQISGIYPHLTMYNNEGECGTGAVVPWAGKLWVITYAPHKPEGSSDKLYEISPDLSRVTRPESIGGTPANRMIHRESRQLFIGPYVIDSKGKLRVIPYTKMMGRLTGNARHLTDPKSKIYYATMEEGFYEVDVETLKVKELYADNQAKEGIYADLLGAHGKGLYSGQGRLVYANNGEKGSEALRDPTITAGLLAQWDGKDWQTVLRSQFTEVTGPGGIYGNDRPAKDPIWCLGWDARSLILMLLDSGQWHQYRLPKGSHSYDGAHGWNTEWPRIRDIEEEDLLATMHGTFWKFPKTFSAKNSAGIAPRSNYLKVVGDFAKWKGKLVLGCDDSAQKEFLNLRPFKSTKGAPLQSNSNLWFIDPEKLDQLGPAIGRGSVWLRDDVKANQHSDPYLFSGYDHRMMVITHKTGSPVTFTLEVDKDGTGSWSELQTITVQDSLIYVFPKTLRGAWIRLKTDIDAKEVSVHFHFRNQDKRSAANDSIFAPITRAGSAQKTKGLIRSNRQVLSMAAGDNYYELSDNLELKSATDAASLELVQAAYQPRSAITVDEASAIVREDGKTYRIPKNDQYRQAQKETKSQTSTKTLDDYLDARLTAGAKVMASSTYKNYEPAHAVDGKINDDSRWIADGADNWIELDLGEAKTFQSFCVVTGWKREAAYVVKNFELQIKKDDAWKTISGGKIEGNQKVTLAINLARPITAQHVRLTSSDKGYMRIYEIALFDQVLDIDDLHNKGPRVARICREVATERDLFNFDGTFYELPARNAQGFAKIRPIATHNLSIDDYGSHFGMIFLTGLSDTSNERVIRSADGKAALWAGVIDDLWKLGKPRGEGGPWKNMEVKANQPSDPYLMTGYDKKSLRLTSSKSADITLEIDIDGTGLWVPYKTFALQAGETISHSFPEGFSAYWVRAISNTDTTATAWFKYE